MSRLRRSEGAGHFCCNYEEDGGVAAEGIIESSRDSIAAPLGESGGAGRCTRDVCGPIEDARETRAVRRTMMRDAGTVLWKTFLLCE